MARCAVRGGSRRPSCHTDFASWMACALRSQCSVVYLARLRSSPSSREVALKVVDRSTLDDPELLAAVRTEVDVLRSTRHPHIVELVEVVCDGSTLAIVTEALMGGDLFGHVNEEGAMTEDAARDVFAELVLAVEHLHCRGYAHRDLKPENIVAIDGSADAFKLVDFGSAIARERCIGLVATAAYCAPEVARSAGYGGELQPRSDSYDFACDLWSLGVLLFFLLSRRLPFHQANSSDDDAVLQRVALGKFDFAPESAWRGVSLEARDLIGRLMTAAPSERADWTAVRAHSWCARAISEKEARAQTGHEPQMTPLGSDDAIAATGETPAGSDGESQSGIDRTTSGGGRASVAEGGCADDKPWTGMGCAVERRALAAATAGGRLQAIIARRMRR